MSVKRIVERRRKAGFNCKRCGGCCKGVEFINVYYEDRKRWERQGRKDLYNPRMLKEWADFGSSGLFKNKTSKRCPFLAKSKEGYYCRVYETRPDVCKYFPLNKTNAKELNCPGYN